METDGKESDLALRKRALSHAAELSARLKQDQKELNHEGAELARRVIAAAERVEKLLAAGQTTEHDRHD